MKITLDINTDRYPLPNKKKYSLNLHIVPLFGREI